MYFEKIKGNNFFGKITEKIDKREAEMSDFDHEYLGGIIERFKPKKILEIGVFAGRTTVDILDFLNHIGLSDSEVFSVDIAKNNSAGRVGYLIDEAKPFLKNHEKSHLFTGVVAPEIIEEISKDGKFDMAIIDTAHYLPGEVLEFLTVLPFLKRNAVVVFHDVILNQRDKNEAQATKIAFDCIVGNKMWNWEEVDYPNIAAVQITEDTYKYINNLISTLTMSWYYDPGSEVLDKYEKIIEKYYDNEGIQLFKKARKMNTEWLQYTNRSVLESFHALIDYRMGRIFIYGAGKNALKYIEHMEKYNKLDKICGLIVSDNQPILEKEIKGIKVFHFSEINFEEKDLVLNSILNKEVEELLEKNNIVYYPHNGVVKERINSSI